MTPASDILGKILSCSQDQPDRPAVKDLNQELTYAGLHDAAGRLAAGLSDRGILEGDRVGLYLANSVDFVVAALACLWIGATFVPLAVNDPEARLAVIVDDCAPAIVLDSTQSGGGAVFPASLRLHPSAALNQVLGSRLAIPPPIAAKERRIAYSIYTSGTTGTPKGVLIDNGSFDWAVSAAATAVGIGPETRTLSVSPFHFDGSFATLFPTLTSGGSVVIRPRDSLLFPRTFFDAVAQEHITYTGFSPSYLRILISSRQLTKLADTDLRIVALGGEASSTADVQSLWEAVPDLRVFNRYGPTETTIAVTNVELTREMLANGYVPIGRPHDGVTFHLVDETGGLINNPGDIGELYIGGRQLMSGYWAAPELTSRVLRTDVIRGETVYQTGDLAFRDEAGNYVYFDRADRVVKRSGVRISLVEVTEVVRGLECVSSAICTTFDDEGRLGVVAFVVLEEPRTQNDLRLEAADHLPMNMVPDRFEMVERLPLTTSSKVDERQLLKGAGLREVQRAVSAARSPKPI